VLICCGCLIFETGSCYVAHCLPSAGITSMPHPALLFFFDGIGVFTQSFMFYRLSHTSSPFCSGFLEMGSWELFAQTGLKPQSS
jgi:hypothetical protein